jgi:surfeit locus 1 family protein
VPTLATVLAVAAFVSAGNWQRDRLQQKEALGARLATAATLPPVSLPAGVDDWAAWRYRVIDATGVFDASRQILIDNRVHAGRVGYHVVTPLLLRDGRTVLVNRGFVAGGATRAELPSAPPPKGEVRVRGRLNLPPAYLELASSPPAGAVWQNLDPQRFARVTGVAVLPVVVEQLDGTPDGLVRVWPSPDSGAGKHRVYMLQWYAFAALAASLWAWFTLRRPAR